MADIAVVVPARNAAGTLGATLVALAGQTVACEVVVVDDGSTDGTVSVARAAGATVVAGCRGLVHPGVHQPPAVGPGAARNAGARATSAPVVAFTDADCVPEPGWAAAGLDALRAADLVQGRVEPDPDAPRHPFDRTLSVPAAYGLFESANLFVTRELFDRLGGFGDGIAAPGKHLAEDVYLGWAARRAGARVAFAPDALVHHAVFPRDWRGFVAERARLRFFGEIVREVPELRDEFLFRRWFLSAHTARFDAALAGIAAAALIKGTVPLINRGAAVAPLLAVVPYAIETRRRARHWPGLRSTTLSAAFVTADAVAAAALAYGAIRSRSVVA